MLWYLNSLISESFHIFVGARTAWEMLSDEQNLKHISTGCEDLNDILGGGIRCGEVTEVGMFFRF